jgi:hypothetical protein
MTDKQPKHASPETAESSKPGRHRRESDEPKVAGWPAGSRVDRPHHPDGWGSGR